MLDTQHQYESNEELMNAVKHSIEHQYMVDEERDIDQPAVACHTKFIVSPKRSFEAAKGYPGKKVTVLNFANNHSVGGSPFSAGAQEESLCRCSTLYPCLQAMKDSFYRSINVSSNRESSTMWAMTISSTPPMSLCSSPMNELRLLSLRCCHGTSGIRSTSSHVLLQN